MGGHQIGGPEPQGQRQLRVVLDRAGGHRGLLAAMGTFPGPCLRLKWPGFARAASGADETLRPTHCEQIWDACRLIGEAALKLDQGVRKVGHAGGPVRNVRFMFYHQPMLSTTANSGPGRTGISLTVITAAPPTSWFPRFWIRRFTPRK